MSVRDWIIAIVVMTIEILIWWHLNFNGWVFIASAIASHRGAWISRKVAR